MVTTKKTLIALAAAFVKNAANVYPGQDYYLRPNNNQYGMPSPYPFSDEEGIGCVFDCNGECIYVFKLSSWNNHFSAPKIRDLEMNWTNALPSFIVPLIIKGSEDVDLNKLSYDLKDHIEARIKESSY